MLTLSRILPNILPYHAHLMYALVHRPAPILSSSIFRPSYPLPKLSIEVTNASESSPLLEKVVTPATVDSKVGSPFPMLTKPTYRVDDSVKIFNYDCGLCAPYLFL